MTQKERLQMLSEWVKDLNPKAYLKKADSRCGNLYAVATPHETWTEYLEPRTLEHVLIMAFHADKFMGIKNA